MRVTSNRASGNRFAVRVFSALGGRIVANSLHDNCVGVIVLASPFGPAGELRMTANAVRHNTRRAHRGRLRRTVGRRRRTGRRNGQTIVGNRISTSIAGSRRSRSGREASSLTRPVGLALAPRVQRQRARPPPQPGTRPATRSEHRRRGPRAPMTRSESNQWAIKSGAQAGAEGSHSTRPFPTRLGRLRRRSTDARSGTRTRRPPAARSARVSFLRRWEDSRDAVAIKLQT
jgi:hypothetical protein